MWYGHAKGGRGRHAPEVESPEMEMSFLAKPAVAVAFGALFLCAETCLHAENVLQFASRPLELPVYDWAAGGLLLTAGLLSHREWSPRRRRLQAVACAFMLSLLVVACFSMLGEWGTPSTENEWISEGVFLSVVGTMTIIALLALIRTMLADES